MAREPASTTLVRRLRDRCCSEERRYDNILPSSSPDPQPGGQVNVNFGGGPFNELALDVMLRVVFGGMLLVMGQVFTSFQRLLELTQVPCNSQICLSLLILIPHGETIQLVHYSTG